MENSRLLSSLEKNPLKQLFATIAPIKKNIALAFIGATLIIIAVYGLTHR